MEESVICERRQSAAARTVPLDQSAESLEVRLVQAGVSDEFQIPASGAQGPKRAAGCFVDPAFNRDLGCANLLR
jgi:hypothetical protein